MNYGSCAYGSAPYGGVSGGKVDTSIDYGIVILPQPRKKRGPQKAKKSKSDKEVVVEV